MESSWQELQEKSNGYSVRAAFAIKQTFGRVLELGAGSGNITRWMVLRPEVISVVAVEGFDEGFRWLTNANIPKVDPRKMKVEALEFKEDERFDSVIICELIEHLYPDEETKMLSAVRPYLAPNARWIVSTPVGFLPDPHHVRGFEKDEFRNHLNRCYGPVSEIDYASGYSQVAWGYWKQEV